MPTVPKKATKDKAVTEKWWCDTCGTEKKDAMTRRQFFSHLRRTHHCFPETTPCSKKGSISSETDKFSTKSYEVIVYKPNNIIFATQTVITKKP